MNVYFIRHGKTKGNLEGRYVGRTDESLLEDGLPETIKNSPPKADTVYVSPMLRCIETSKKLYPGQTPTIITELREIDFGEFEYKSYEELNGNPIYQAWIDSNGMLPFPKGESREVFSKRCIKGFQKALYDAIENGYENIVFIIHGGSIMAILDAYSTPHKDYFHWQVKNGNGYKGKIEVKVEGKSFSTIDLKFTKKEMGNIDERMVISTLHRLFD